MKSKVNWFVAKMTDEETKRFDKLARAANRSRTKQLEVVLREFIRKLKEE